MTLHFEADLLAAAHRAERWCGEPLLHDGEDVATALAPETVRRAALDAALAEMERGLLEPSYEWRRDYALVLGLERVLAAPQPRLASGTTLRRHQVDALAGQLAALIGDLERAQLNGDDETDDEDDEEDTSELKLSELATVAVEGPGFDDDFDDEDDEDDEDADTDGIAPAEEPLAYADPAVAVVAVEDEEED